MNDIYSIVNNREAEFMTTFRGKFVGVLTWEQLDDLWTTLRARATQQWYVYQIGEPPPELPLMPDQLHRLVSELDALLRRDHLYDYCGIVYADNLQEPTLIKVFDPNNLGSSCGFSGTTVLPGWIISRLPPVDLHATLPPPNSRRRWWQKLFS